MKNECYYEKQWIDCEHYFQVQRIIQSEIVSWNAIKLYLSLSHSFVFFNVLLFIGSPYVHYFSIVSHTVWAVV